MVKDESVDAMDDLGSERMLVTLLEGTLRYEDALLPTVDMEDRSGPLRRMRSGDVVRTQWHKTITVTDLHYAPLPTT